MSFNELARLRMEANHHDHWKEIYERLVSWELELTRLVDVGHRELAGNRLARERREDLARYVTLTLDQFNGQRRRFRDELEEAIRLVVEAAGGS